MAYLVVVYMLHVLCSTLVRVLTACGAPGVGGDTYLLAAQPRLSFSAGNFSHRCVEEPWQSLWLYVRQTLFILVVKTF